jgi:uncharacterized DUF497 family protein
MRISFDPAKRARTLAERGLDFEDAPRIFRARNLTLEDARRDYGEVRFQTIGTLDDRLVMVVWTPRDGVRHVISMRKCNDREAAKYGLRLGRP